MQRRLAGMVFAAAAAIGLATAGLGSSARAETDGAGRQPMPAISPEARPLPSDARLEESDTPPPDAAESGSVLRGDVLGGDVLAGDVLDGEVLGGDVLHGIGATAAPLAQPNTWADDDASRPADPMNTSR